MICPYNRKSQKQVMQYTNELVDETSGVIKGYQHVVLDTFEMMKCPEDGCAAWQNGSCHYVSANMNNE